jgi:D-ribulokinase
MSGPIVIGIDMGTSGARAVAMAQDGAIIKSAAALLSDFGANSRDPALWWRTVESALGALLDTLDRASVRAMAIDGTSGTVLPIDTSGAALADAMMYNDPVSDEIVLGLIARHAPETSAAHGRTSGLAKLLAFAKTYPGRHCCHQADWLLGQFCGRFDITDENNALKTGYDPVARHWPGWIERTGALMRLLPRVMQPGAPVARITPAVARRFRLLPDVLMVAGTTDGCASFLATGACKAGEGVTALGSSLTIKLLSPEPIFAPHYGIYSHRMGDQWLAGGASNTGGKVLLKYFTPEQMQALSQKIDPATETGLDYYPLLIRGERFPIADPDLQPRLSPRPKADAQFLAGLFEGIASIERIAYQRLTELGGPLLTSLRSVGGGARNPVWSTMRERMLGVPFVPALSEEAAAGSARLALIGARRAGLL